MPATTDKDPQFAYTLAKGLGVLRAFDASVSALGNREIAERTGIGRATVVRLTRTLAMLGYLKYNESTARYRLAAPVLSFAYPLLCQLSVRQFARPHMQELANFAHGAVSLAMRGGDQLVLVETCIDQAAPTGRPYYWATDDTERAQIDAALQARDPGGWPAQRRRLHASRKQFAAAGYCTVAQADTGLRGVSVPVRSLVDDELLVLNCVVAPFLLHSDTLEQQIAPRLFNLVRLLQAAMGRR